MLCCVTSPYSANAHACIFIPQEQAAIYHCIHVIIKENVQQLNVKGMRHAVLLMVRHEAVKYLPIVELQAKDTAYAQL